MFLEHDGNTRRALTCTVPRDAASGFVLTTHAGVFDDILMPLSFFLVLYSSNKQRKKETQSAITVKTMYVREVERGVVRPFRRIKFRFLERAIQ